MCTAIVAILACVVSAMASLVMFRATILSVYNPWWRTRPHHNYLSVWTRWRVITISVAIVVRRVIRSIGT